MAKSTRTTPGKLAILADEQGITVLMLVKNAITQSGGSQLAAAQFLGVSPSAIRYQMKKANLRPVIMQTVEFEQVTV